MQDRHIGTHGHTPVCCRWKKARGLEIGTRLSGRMSYSECPYHRCCRALRLGCCVCVHPSSVAERCTMSVSTGSMAGHTLRACSIHGSNFTFLSGLTPCTSMLLLDASCRERGEVVVSCDAAKYSSLRRLLSTRKLRGFSSFMLSCPTLVFASVGTRYISYSCTFDAPRPPSALICLSVCWSVVFCGYPVFHRDGPVMSNSELHLRVQESSATVLAS